MKQNLRGAHKTRDAEVMRQRILALVQDYITTHGYPPTVKEIGDAVGTSRQAASRHLNALQEQGFLTRGEGSRALSLN